MKRVINPEEIIRDYLQQNVLIPIRMEGREPTGEEIHSGVITAAAILLINLTTFDNYCLDSEFGKGSNITIITKVAEKIDEGFKSAHPDLAYSQLLIKKQCDLLESDMPIQSLI